MGATTCGGSEIGGVVFLHGGIPPGLTSIVDWMKSITKCTRRSRISTRRCKSWRRGKIILPFFTIREIVLAVQGQLLERAPGKRGLTPEYHNKLVRLLDFSNWLCMRDEGPLWFRGYDGWSEEEGGQQIRKVLEAYNADTLVVAHTVQKPTQIRSRFGRKAFLIDTGMLSTYWSGGRASALDILRTANSSPSTWMDRKCCRRKQMLHRPGHPNECGRENRVERGLKT